MPQNASSSLRYISSTATRLLIPWQYPKACDERGGEGGERGGMGEEGEVLVKSLHQTKNTPLYM